MSNAKVMDEAQLVQLLQDHGELINMTPNPDCTPWWAIDGDSMRKAFEGKVLLPADDYQRLREVVECIPVHRLLIAVRKLHDAGLHSNAREISEWLAKVKP